MKQMASLLWKDLRGLRWELAAWLALNVALAIARPGLATLEAGSLWEARPFWALLC